MRIFLLSFLLLSTILPAHQTQHRALISRTKSDMRNIGLYLNTDSQHLLEDKILEDNIVDPWKIKYLVYSPFRIVLFFLFPLFLALCVIAFIEFLFFLINKFNNNEPKNQNKLSIFFL